MRNKTFLTICQNIIKLNGIPRNHQHLNPDMLKNQSGYIVSEIDETLDALKNGDRQGFIDGLADVLVTVVYWEFIRSKHAAHFEEVFANVMASETDKMDAAHVAEKLGILKNWVSEAAPSIPVGRALLLTYSIIEFTDRTTQADFEQLRSSQCALPDGETLMEAACQAVEESNFSKFPPVESVDLEENIAYIKAKKGIADVGYRIKDGLVAFVNLADDKFQKPKTFKEPDLQWVRQIKSLDLMFTD